MNSTVDEGHILQSGAGIPLARWEAGLVAAATGVALVLGFANLGHTSIWHDEAVQVFVSKSIAQTGWPLLPSGRIHPVALVANAVTALFITVFGAGEVAVRSPSVLFAGCNVLLVFVVLRSLLGRATALVAAFGLALSPWSVAWSREARFYELQQTFYLLMLWATWRLTLGEHARAMLRPAIAVGAVYLLGLGTSLHSVLFFTPLCAYAFCMVIYERGMRPRWTILWAVAALTGLATMLFYRASLPQADADAIFKSAGLGTQRGDAGNPPLLYYFAWLWENLSAGFFVLALAGFGLMLWREGKRGLFVTLAFWAPVLALTFLVTYRIHRFMYFAFPAYVAAFSYGAVTLARFVAQTVQTLRERQRAKAGVFTDGAVLLRTVLAVVLVAFGARLAVSAARLVWDSLDAARGADTTLATRHPQWRGPCQYVREHLDAETAVITTTYVSTLYYVGRVDNWFPNRYLFYEYWETGLDGLKDVNDLAAFMSEHPKGYFLAEWFRFWHFDFMKPDVDWVEAHMTRLDDVSSGDVRVYAWGLDAP